MKKKKHISKNIFFFSTPFTDEHIYKKIQTLQLTANFCLLGERARHHVGPPVTAVRDLTVQEARSYSSKKP